MNVSISQLICIIILFVCLIFVSFKCVATLEKENKRLQQQIEKMKNCANCDHWFDMDSTCELHKEEIPVFMIDCGCKDWECAYKEEEE